MASISTKPQITTGSSCIALPINQIVLTEEHLKVTLANIYESGIKDTAQFRWSKIGPICFSIASTLVITCLTSQFNDFSTHIKLATSKTLTAMAWILFAIFFIVGCFLLCKRRSEDDVFKCRDEAVNAALEKIIKNKN